MHIQDNENNFVQQDFNTIAELLKSPDIEIRKKAILELGELALVMVETNPGATYLANLLQNEGNKHQLDGINRLVSAHNQVVKQLESENELLENDRHFRSLFENASDGIIYIAPDSRVAKINNSFALMHGYTLEELQDIDLQDFDVENLSDILSERRQLTANGENLKFEVQHRHKDGHLIDLEVTQSLVEINDQEYTVAFHRDITERKQTLKYFEMNAEILKILNKPGNIHDSMQSIISVLKDRTGIDAVGIRLQDGEDFPYFSEKGFPKELLLTENSLIELGIDNSICRDKDGNAILECTCGLVIGGKTDSANPLFTKGGSFWTNDSVPLLDLSADQDPRHNPRNKCIHEGYASVVLIPIRDNDKIVGLFHFNDKQKNRFTLNMIQRMENIAAHVGQALTRKQIENDLRNSEEQYRLLYENMAEGIAMHRLIFDADGNAVDYIIEGVNKSFENITGLSAEQAVGKKASQVYGVNPAPYLQQYSDVAKDGQPTHFETEYTPMQKCFAISVTSVDNQHFSTVFEDITERKDMEEELRVMATRDPLTHLLNKEVLRNELQNLMENDNQKKPTAFLMFDLMGFGEINKEYGHAVGDNILIEFAKSLNNSFRQVRTQKSEQSSNTDVIASLRDENIASRFGGDEFAVILNDFDSTNTINLMEFTVEKSKQILLGIKNLLLSKGINGFGIYANIARIDPDIHKNYDDIVNAADPKLKLKNYGNRVEIIMQIDKHGNVSFWDEIHRCFL
jgi:PAS domain S-box-containing protein